MRSLHFASCLAFVAVIGCGGSSFDVPEEQTDTNPADSAGGETTTDAGGDTAVPPGDAPADTAWPDAACTAPTADATDVYVDGSVAATGLGAASCPFKTILEATKAPLNPTVTRTIHVKAGSYAETDALLLKGNMRLFGEFGVVKLSGGSSAPCAPSPERCNISMEHGAIVDSFDVDAKQVGNGIFAPGGPTPTGGTALIVRNTSVHSSQKDGIVLLAGGELGPNVHVDENGAAGVIARAGRVHVVAGTNTFDNNKGKGVWVGSTYYAAGGMVLYNATLDFEGGSASNNASGGVSFDWGSTAGSTTTQKITGLVAKGNNSGLTLPGNQSGLVLRKSTLTKNVTYGLWLGWNNTRSNKWDIGDATSGGGNVFGGKSENNGKVGIFLCGSGLTASQPADGNSFTNCPPTQTIVPNCDAYPPSYADIGYVTAKSITPATAGANPVIVPASCTVGP